MMKKPEEYLYRTKFKALATLGDEAKNLNFVSQASMGIEDLRKLIPESTKNLNNFVLNAAFNAAVVNLVNANDDAIATDTANKIAKGFISQPINVEHDSSHVIGYITNAGFSSFGEESTLLAEDQVTSEVGPYNIALSCLIWKYVDSWAADFLEMSNDEKSFFYKKVSASWEVCFDDYQIILGSKKLSDATIVTDPEEIKKYSKFLKAMGGTGYTNDGTPVYRLIVGDAVPVGIGFTSNPAAAVKGIVIEEEKEEETEDDDSEDEMENESSECETEMEDEDMEKAKKVSKCSESQEKNNILEKNVEKSSQNNSPTVKFIKYMKFANIEDFVNKVTASDAEVSVASVAEFIKEQVKLGDEKFAQAQKEALEKSQALENASAELSEAKSQMEAFKLKLEELENKAKEIEKQSILDSRLDSLASKYNLDDKTRKVIVKQIASLDEEGYEAWLQEDGEVILASKVIQVTKVKSEDEVEKETLESIKTAVASTEFVPNASDNTEKQKEVLKPLVIGKGKDVEITL